jgi:hypothetical protein
MVGQLKMLHQMPHLSPDLLHLLSVCLRLRYHLTILVCLFHLFRQCYRLPIPVFSKEKRWSILLKGGAFGGAFGPFLTCSTFPNPF